MSSNFSSTRVLSVLALSIAAVTISSDPAFATSGPTSIETAICNMLVLIQGNIGRGIAAFAVIMIGLSLFLGKVSWGLAISTVLGIGAIFGAGSIVSALGGGTSTCQNTTQSLTNTNS